MKKQQTKVVKKETKETIPNMVDESSFKHQYNPAGIPITENPKPIDNPFNENDFVSVDEINDKQDTIIYPMKCCIETCPEWGSAVQVTKWFNETGYEIIINNKGAFQHLSITNEELDLVFKMKEKLTPKE